MASETWKDIAGFEGYYDISTLGRVRSLRFVALRHNRPRDVPMVLACDLNDGYRRVALNRNKVRVCRKVSVLVLETFVGPRPAGHEAAHMNGVRGDDRLENLSWVTKQENMSHKALHGTIPRGVRCRSSKLTDDDVRAIRASKLRGVALARAFNVSSSVITAVRKRQSWRHVA